MNGQDVNSEEPKKLWRYRPSKNNFGRTLLEMEGETWCAFAEALNDPFDGISNSLTETEVHRFRSIDGDGQPSREVHEVENDLRWGVICFSSSWNNPTMWAHYADNYTGIAYGYTVSKLREFIAQNNSGNGRASQHLGTPKIELREVEYHRSLPDSFDDPYDAFCAKSDHWKYENEWRMLAQHRLIAGSTAKGFKLNLFDCVSDVLFGPRVDEGVKIAIWQYIEAKKLNVRMKHLRIDKRSFSLF